MLTYLSKRIFAVVLLSSVALSASAATISLSWPQVTSCTYDIATTDAAGNILVSCGERVGKVVPMTARLNEADPNIPTIINGSCVYTSIVHARVGLGNEAAMLATCAPALPAPIVKTPPGANDKNVSVVVMPDGTWGWRSAN